MTDPKDRRATTATRKAGDKVEIEDVDDVIEIASELQDDEDDDLSVEDVVEIGEELGLEARHVEAAVEEQERREEAEEQAERSQVARRKRRLMIGAAVGAAVLVVFVMVSMAGQKALNRSLSDVRQKRAQVRSVIERRADVEASYAGRDNLTTAADAELAGARNRVGVETQRYDRVAAAYNADASGFPASLWVALFGLPDSVPLSSEIEEW